ncbi:MAG: hypothetical protein LBJ14_00735 [Desulfarculales bacterium]|jgi:lipopolysaccharide biosynthesis regulator YciM|nr:hypothetical protein [Desulfarculales bacterium]
MDPPSAALTGAGLLLLGIGIALAQLVRTRRRRGISFKKAGAAVFLPQDMILKAKEQNERLREFIDGLRITQASAEYYHDLGDSLRQKGELESAILLRQHMMDHPALSEEEKKKAWFALGLDYRQSGMLNKAAETFGALLQADPNHADAGRNLVYLYEELQEWDQAILARKRVDKILNKSSPAILAHYQTELGKKLAAGNPVLAEQNFGQAIKTHRQCLDAYLHLGDLYLDSRMTGKAFEIWSLAAAVAPAYAHLIISRLRRIAFNDRAMEEAVAKIFPAVNDLHPLPLLELSKWYLSREKDYKAMTLLNLALEKAPGFLAAHDLRGQILVKQNHNTPLYGDYQKLLNQIKDKTSTGYRCRHCGFTSYSLSWQCPRCRHWDSIDALTA